MKRLTKYRFKISYSILSIFLILLSFGCSNTISEVNNEEPNIIGNWVRIGQSGPIRMSFTESGFLKTDFGNDNMYEVISKYTTTNNVITIVDKEGYSCDKPGLYNVDNDDYYLSMDLLKDSCNGRVMTTIGYWTRPNFKELISNLDSLINISPNRKDYYLSRARINMAIGMPNLAISDLDKYILIDSSNGEAFLNRAAIKLTNDTRGAIADCEISIAINPNDKNAYLMLGLAQYKSGMIEDACLNYKKSIDLGLTYLTDNQYEDCKDYW
ncbi:MAG: tetratricopeptide repeat protein [Lentimicrobiaceae bacterium]|jgi:tetratricopeptide (TPR) repeat protein|nr:tetratricopeptide repeat protein [Lentimicrobiaceae bacterium]MBT4190344.1 tetratricopeptide repeat protein [Lentimicrobiaceae bacterium]MBT4801017.1 tetratricopeptide repeat protein [Lentimicrobiaceae bacterium]MBT5669932.1 tetratricopeptide repeat protein [Lentimicrobiaceae bacterium]MBT6016615.1 tetratricopeptide repeat protein [Lentimicrobiaceae bacterium]